MWLQIRIFVAKLWILAASHLEQPRRPGVVFLFHQDSACLTFCTPEKDQQRRDWQLASESVSH